MLGAERLVVFEYEKGEGEQDPAAEHEPLAVDRHNVSRFAERYARHKLYDSLEQQSDAFRRGLCDVLGAESLLSLFSAEELGELIGGKDEIDDDAVAAWRAATTYQGGVPAPPPSARAPRPLSARLSKYRAQ